MTYFDLTCDIVLTVRGESWLCMYYITCAWLVTLYSLSGQSWLCMYYITCAWLVTLNLLSSEPWLCMYYKYVLCVLTVRVSPDCDDFRLGSRPAFVGVASDVDGVLGVRPQTLYLSGCFTVHHNTLYLFTYKQKKTGCLQMITKLVSNRWQHKPSSRFCTL